MAQEALINYNVCRQIHQGIIRNKWDLVSKLFADHGIGVNDDITWDRETPLFIAVGTSNSYNIVENLVRLIMADGGGGVEALRTRCSDEGYNPLHVAARKGNIKSAKLLVRNDPVMPQILSVNGRTTALSLAAWNCDEEMVKYLMTVTRDITTTYPDGTTSPSPFRGISGSSFLTYTVIAGFYDVAVYLVRTYPELAYVVFEDLTWRPTVLTEIAARETAFPSGSGLRTLGRIVYSGLYVKISDYSPTPLQDAPTNAVFYAITWFCGVIVAAGQYILQCLAVAEYLWNIYNMKVKHKHAKKLVEEILSVLSDRPHNETRRILADAIQTAARIGSFELIEKCVQEHPEQLWYTEPGFVLSFIKTAIKHRREKVFNLIYQFSSHKQQVLAYIDGENALHIVGKLPAYDRLQTVSGSALQMQRELQWFKEVEKIIEPSQRGVHQQTRNSQGEIIYGRTGREIFTDEHEQLLKDAQQWTKDTSASSTVVAALLVTMTFAAMFTVPGGNDDDGKLNFLEDKVVLLFVIADAIALFSSCTSVLMFLSTLTHYSQEDFLSVLPLRLTLGLLSLFISVVTTMIAFSATLVLLLRDRYEWIERATVVSSIPAILFIWLQYPLLRELIVPNLRSIFRKQSNVVLQ